MTKLIAPRLHIYNAFFAVMKLAMVFRDHRHYRAGGWVHVFEVHGRPLFNFIFLLYALTLELKKRKFIFFVLQTEKYVILKM